MKTSPDLTAPFRVSVAAVRYDVDGSVDPAVSVPGLETSICGWMANE